VHTRFPSTHRSVPHRWLGPEVALLPQRLRSGGFVDAPFGVWIISPPRHSSGCTGALAASTRAQDWRRAIISGCR